MQPIRINKNRPELKEQLDFLIKQEFRLVYRNYRNFPYYLIGWTFLTILLTLLPDTKFLITLKAVMIFLTGLLWICSLLFLLTIIFRKYKRIAWRDTMIQYCSQNDTEAFMSFDNEKISFVTNTYKTELNWDYYANYAFDKDSIFIIPSRNIYEALYYSQTEIGVDNFEALKTLATEKLNQMP